MVKIFYAKKHQILQLEDSTTNIFPITELKILQSFFFKLTKNKYNNYTITTGNLINKKIQYVNTTIDVFSNIEKKLNFLKIYDPISMWDFIFAGSIVGVQSLTIGKGFCGGIKKHGFHRGPQSHGSKHNRLQGSLGAGTSPGRVFPGKRMSGRIGVEKKTIKNLTVLDFNKAQNLVIVKGSIPGNTGTLVKITSI